MDLQKLSKQLRTFIDEQAEKMCMPIQQGNSVRIKHFVVRRNPYGFLVYDVRKNRQIATTFTKTAALAMAKQLSNNHKVDVIRNTDSLIEHKYNECVFYKHTIAKTDDEVRRESAKIRYDIAWEDLLKLRDTLEYYIFDK